MDMTGEYRIAAPRQRVWEALNDPETLRQCIPGCEEIQKLSDTEWTARVVAKIGPVKANFGGKVTLSDLDPPSGYTITGEGAGGAAGFAKGGAKVALADDGGGTLLTYIVQAQVGGKLAQIGSRLVDAAARKMAGDFFGCFAANLAGPAPAAPEPVEAQPVEAQPAEALAPAATATAPSPAPAPAPAPRPQQPPDARPKTLKPIVWAVILAIIVAIILWAAVG